MAAILIAVNQVIGGVEVEHQLFRRHLERSDELVNEDALHGYRGLAISTVLEPAQRRTKGRCTILADRSLQRQIVAQPIVIVQVFVALAQTEHPLPQQLFGAVLHQTRVARIGQHIGHRFQQSESPLNLPQQQQASIRSDITAIKRTSISRRPSFVNGTCVTVQFGIGGISTTICLDNRFNVGSDDSADLILRLGMKYSG